MSSSLSNPRPARSNMHIPLQTNSYYPLYFVLVYFKTVQLVYVFCCLGIFVFIATFFQRSWADMKPLYPKLFLGPQSTEWLYQVSQQKHPAFEKILIPQYQSNDVENFLVLFYLGSVIYPALIGHSFRRNFL